MVRKFKKYISLVIYIIKATFIKTCNFSKVTLNVSESVFLNINKVIPQKQNLYSYAVNL